jgi:hypothetical protein
MAKKKAAKAKPRAAVKKKTAKKAPKAKPKSAAKKVAKKTPAKPKAKPKAAKKPPAKAKLKPQPKPEPKPTGPTDSQLSLAKRLLNGMPDKELRDIWLCLYGYADDVTKEDIPDERETIVTHLMSECCNVRLTDDMTAKELGDWLAGY